MKTTNCDPIPKKEDLKETRDDLIRKRMVLIIKDFLTSLPHTP